ncbi:hypothetical protein MTO96_016602 [Rhipicephalus appendiculatus]
MVRRVVFVGDARTPHSNSESSARARARTDVALRGADGGRVSHLAQPRKDQKDRVGDAEPPSQSGSHRPIGPPAFARVLLLAAPKSTHTMPLVYEPRDASDNQLPYLAAENAVGRSFVCDKPDLCCIVDLITPSTCSLGRQHAMLEFRGS